MPLALLFAARPLSYSCGGLLVVALMLALLFDKLGRKVLFGLVALKVIAMTIIGAHLMISPGRPAAKPIRSPGDVQQGRPTTQPPR